uniref:Uncharacterized protein n=1 Tax=Megaselia scalaris TaxID=36166 RepID=T1GHD5_MEGSC
MLDLGVNLKYLGNVLVLKLQYHLNFGENPSKKDQIFSHCSNLTPSEKFIIKRGKKFVGV